MIGTVILFVAAKAPLTMGIGAAFLVQVALTVLLGAIPGNPGPNRYGPPPGQPSPQEVAEVFR